MLKRQAQEHTPMLILAIRRALNSETYNLAHHSGGLELLVQKPGRFDLSGRWDTWQRDGDAGRPTPLGGRLSRPKNKTSLLLSYLELLASLRTTRKPPHTHSSTGYPASDPQLFSLPNPKTCRNKKLLSLFLSFSLSLFLSLLGLLVSRGGEDKHAAAHEPGWHSPRERESGSESAREREIKRREILATERSRDPETERERERERGKRGKRGRARLPRLGPRSGRYNSSAAICRSCARTLDAPPPFSTA